MKKLLIIALVFVSLFALVACGETKEPIDLVNEKISLQETKLYTADSEDYFAELRLVDGEDVTALDGKVGEKSVKYIFKLKPKKLDMMNGEYSVTISGDKGSENIKIEKDVMGMSYSAKLMNIDKAGVPSRLTIVYNDKNFEMELADMMKDITCDSKKAVEIAYNELKDALKDDLTKKEFLREVTVRYINNSKDATSPYYWYVSMLKSKDDYFAVLIDPKDGKVINKKVL